MARSSERIHDEEGTDKLKHRRGSLSALPPYMTEQTEDSVSHKDETEAPKSKNPDQLDIKPVILIMMALMGALVGSVVGGPYGTGWAGVGIVTGFVVSVLLGWWLFKLIA